MESHMGPPGSGCFHPGHSMLHPGHVHPGRMGPSGSGSMLTLHLGHVQHYHPTLAFP